ncbi:hypothetical protein E4656_14085 [Natronospirillum operosum]|uniref:Uncharacterized protein n=1 Tax=Natronospirillum operosum TaxID=2759953 RepID=A0A4Z0WDG0_9GAMM|nr:hypothetical protein [Natronospirillum operosum]TGG92008.1 hypothetical protein E4656_14085 [Natronospirillum operosum]
MVQLVKLNFVKSDDKKLITCFKKITGEVGFHQLNIHNHGISATSIDPENWEDELDEFAIARKYRINRIRLKIADITFDFQRGGGEPETAAFIDQMIVSRNDRSNQEQLEEDQLAQAMDIIADQLYASSDLTRLTTSTRQASNVLASHEAVLERLESLNADMLEKIRDERLEMESDYRARTDDLETQYQDRHKELHEELKGKFQELEKREKQLDDRSNTHARRENRKQLIETISDRQKEFNLTHGTRQMRWPVRVAVASSLVLLSFIMAFVVIFWDIAGGDSSIYGYLYFASLSFALIGLIFYWLRWENDWLQRHAEAEFKIKQFELDIERANWAVESALEWTALGDKVMPERLIEQITAGLFESKAGNSGSSNANAADQLASAILGSSRSVKLKAGDNELNVDVKKLQKQALEEG